MPKAKISAHTVDLLWDDDSISKYQLHSLSDEDLGACVSIQFQESYISLNKESWPVIKESVDTLFLEMEAEDD